MNLYLPQLRLPGFEGHRLWPVICSILLFPWPSVSLCLWRAVYCLLPLPLPCLKVTRSQGRGQLIWILEPVTRDKRPNNQTMESVSSIVKRRSTVNNYLHMTLTNLESKFKHKHFQRNYVLVFGENFERIQRSSRQSSDLHYALYLLNSTLDITWNIWKFSWNIVKLRSRSHFRSHSRSQVRSRSSPGQVPLRSWLGPGPGQNSWTWANTKFGLSPPTTTTKLFLCSKWLQTITVWLLTMSH